MVVNSNDLNTDVLLYCLLFNMQFFKLCGEYSSCFQHLWCISLCHILCFFKSRTPHFSPQSPLCVPKCWKGKTHRWGLSKTRDELYNTQAPTTCVMHVRCQSTWEGIASKNMNPDKSKQTSKMFVKAKHTRSALRIYEESAAGSSQCIHTEGQAETDRWWCTSDSNSQGTSRFSPGCCTLSRNTNCPKTTDGVKTKWQGLASWKVI